MSLELFFQQLYEDKVKWRYVVNASETVDILPYKLLSKPEGVLEFSRKTKASSLSVLKTLSTKSEVVKELIFKLVEDEHNGALVNLEDFS